MTNLGVFVTSHVCKVEDVPHRHGASAMELHPYYFEKVMLGAYKKYDPGLDLSLHICDTGSTHPLFKDIVKDPIVKSVLKTPNCCAAFAGLKHLMHSKETESLRNQYDYYLFHVDDGVEPCEDNWGSTLVEHFEKNPSLGLLVRQLDTEIMSKDGLVNHRNICVQMSKIWGIEAPTETPHPHADWWMLSRESLNALANVWYDPIKDQAAMDFQRQYEEVDFKKLCELDPSRRLCDTIHLGRECEGAMRMSYAGFDSAGVSKPVLNIRPIYKRKEELCA